MNEDVKAEWLAALRSGEYKQTIGALEYTEHNNDDEDLVGYCCLGVLCDLAAKKGITGRKIHRVSVRSVTDADYFEDVLYGSDQAGWISQILPADVQIWADITGGNPDIALDDGFGTTSLAELNDMGKSFAEIADIIEEHL